MEERLAPVRGKAMALLALALLVCANWLGWWTLAPMVVAVAGFKIVDASLHRFARPEYALAGVWMLTQAMIAASIHLTGGAHSPAMAWLVIPVVTLPARYDMRGVIAGVLYTAGLMLAITAGLDFSAVWHEPQFLVAPLAMLFAVAILSTALMNSDLEHRQDSVLDTLTGMLNRRSLSSRVVELAEQAKVTAEPVGIIVADIDHFKHVNDAHGHQVGDAVLVDVAYALRKDLRAFDLAYRLGGEEFLVLLPGASAKDCAAVAERLRQTIESSSCGGLSVTMSFGTASSCGESFDWDYLLASADAALYQAKRDGRNQVVCATGSPQLVE